MNQGYEDPGPALAEIEALEGPVILEFGAPWCSYCRAAQPLLAAELAHHSRVRLIRVEDGRGRPLGRSFRVKLWPTFVFLNRGQETVRLVRPTDQHEIAQALTQINGRDER